MRPGLLVNGCVAALASLGSVEAACQFQIITFNQCWTQCAYSQLSATTCIPSCIPAQDLACVCGDSTYNAAVARCVETSCGPNILAEGADIYESNCAAVGVSLSAQQFIQEGQQAPSSAAQSDTPPAQASATSMQRASSAASPAVASPSAVTPSPSPANVTPSSVTAVPLATTTVGAAGKNGPCEAMEWLGLLAAAVNGAAMML